MEEFLNGKPLFLDFHSLVTVRACDLSDEVRAALIDFFGMFLSDGSREIQEHCDILLSPADNKIEPVFHVHSKDMLPFWIKEHEGKTYVVFGYKGHPDILVRLSHPIGIFYTPRPKVFGRLFNVIIHCLQLALIRKGGILFHGAVLCKDDNLLITGPEGTGKTPLSLYLLKAGWDYVSEDKFIFSNGRAFLFRPYIPVRSHHFHLFPWLPDSVNGKYSFGRLYVREFLNKLAKKCIPETIYIKLNRRYFDPPIFTHVHKLFPDCTLINSAILSKAFILVRGPELGCSSINEDEITQVIRSIHWLAFPELEKMLMLLSLHGFNYYHDVDKILKDNLKNLALYRVSVPSDFPVDILAKFLMEQGKNNNDSRPDLNKGRGNENS